MMSFGPQAPRRRMALTPMIDVVFLLLVFFMLASRFGQDRVLELAIGGGGAAVQWVGPPRLVDIGAGELRLNGQPLALHALPGALGALMQSPADPVILRMQGQAAAQDLLSVMSGLRAAGLNTLLLAE